MAKREGIFQHLATLSDPLRVRLLQLLSREELGVGELARVVQSPQSTVSRHLKALRLDGWIAVRSEGTTNLFRLEASLPDPDLWQVVGRSAAIDPEDLRRLESVLAARRVDASSWFGRVAATWDEVRRELYGDQFALPALLSLLPEDLVVADLGCGTGALLEALAPVVSQVIGVDREPAMLQAAARRVERFDNVSLRPGDLSDLPIDDAAVDGAIFMLVLHTLDDVAAALAQAARITRPDGRIVVLDMVEHDRTDYRHSMGHVHLGFSASAFDDHAGRAGLSVRRYQRLPANPEALGPGLFVAVLGR